MSMRKHVMDAPQVPQFNLAEFCDRLKYEFDVLQNQNNLLKMENERLKAERAELQQQSRNHFETAYFLNVQTHKQAEMNGRFMRILKDITKMIPLEQQKALNDEIEAAKRVSVGDIERRIKNQLLCTDPFQTDLISDTQHHLQQPLYPPHPALIPTAIPTHAPNVMPEDEGRHSPTSNHSAPPAATHLTSSSTTPTPIPAPPAAAATANLNGASQQLLSTPSISQAQEAAADDAPSKKRFRIDEIQAEAPDAAAGNRESFGHIAQQESDFTSRPNANEKKDETSSPVKPAGEHGPQVMEQEDRDDKFSDVGGASLDEEATKASDDAIDDNMSDTSDQQSIDQEEKISRDGFESISHAAIDSMASTTRTKSSALQRLEEEEQEMANNNNNASPSNKDKIPKQIRTMTVLPHTHSVSALAFNELGTRVYTGGKGVVKMWSTNAEQNNEKLAEINCLKDSYIRSCKLTNDESQMIICGETKEIVVWDLQHNQLKHTMETSVPFHYALTLSKDGRTCFSCFSDGNVGMWDLVSGKLVRRFSGHTDSVSCIDISGDGKTLVSGSLDKSLRVWDWGSAKEISSHSFPAQIFTLGVCPASDSWVAVGLEDSNVEVLDLRNPRQNYQLHLHESCVLSLRFAPNGNWFVTGGKDKLLNVWKSPYGPGIAQTREPNSILCCDISPNLQFIGTGSWERMAALYQVIY